MRIEDRLRKSLDMRMADNSYRSLSEEKNLLDFFSNDYLGLSRNSDLYDQIVKKHHAQPKNGATGSRLLSGNSNYYEQVEEKLATILSAESTLLFNSGYVANLALISSIPQRGDILIYDELAHACIKDGARLSLAKRYSFNHNDLHDLEQKLKISTGNIFIVVESIYSMDGDECPLTDLISLANTYNANIIIDEAHSTGVFGPNGSGLSGHLNVMDKLFARVYTFGKAMGIHGAAIACSKTLKEYLVNFARPFIYTTALPPHSIAAVDCAFDHLIAHPTLQEQSAQKVKLFNNLYEKEIGQQFVKIASQHPIQSIIIPGNDRVRIVASHLSEKGFDTRPILSPTVKKGTERLRICLHTYNSNDDISRLIDTLAALK